MKPSRDADPALEREVTIVHQDEERLVVHKPPGLATTRPDEGPCLTRAVEHLDRSAPMLHATSRLDAEVSGLVTFARSREGNHRLMEARKAGVYRRRYLALAQGSLPAERGRWTWSIGMDPRDKRRRVARPADDRKAKESATRFEVLAALPLPHDDGALLLLRLEPESGRTHQLRVHAREAGVPLLGDVHYGGPRRVVGDEGRVVSLRRVALHCARLQLPALGRSPLPAEMNVAISPALSPPLDLRARLPDDLRAVFLALGGDEATLAAALDAEWL